MSLSGEAETTRSRPVQPGPSAGVALIGMMGAGKSTVGELLAARLGWRYVDTDDEIRRRTGRSVGEIWRAEGEAGFRAEEASAVADASRAPQPSVAALGGGAVLSAANRAAIAASGALVVWLRAGVDTLVERVAAGSDRPLLEGDAAGAMARLESERRSVYESIAEVVIETDRLGPDQIVDRVVAALDARRRVS